jgi:hypothetical protein
MTMVDWDAIGKDVPKASARVLELLKEAWVREGDDPAREVEKALRQKIGELARRFEDLKEGAG